MNKLDKQYTELLQAILDYGVEKKDRTGTGTKSIFGYTIRHKMSDGFPLLTTKKMPFKTMVTELVWFLRGDTNIKFLVDNNCHIWDGDAYKNYKKYYTKKYNGTDGLRINQYPLSDSTIENIILSQEEFIGKIKTDDEFAKKWGELGPIYGKQWRKWDSITKKWWNDPEYQGYGSDNRSCWEYNETQIDQIQNSINLLKTDPDSRRNRISAWNVGELDQMVLPPCHTDFQFYTRELSLEERYQLVRVSGLYPKYSFEIEDGKSVPNKLSENEWYDKFNVPTRAISLMWNQRSVDTFLGLPFNIASYGLLLEIIAKEVNMVPDELIGNLGDTHLYLNHIEQAKQQINRDSFDLPKLNLNTEFWITESEECGVGPLSASGFVSSLADVYFCKCLLEGDIQLSNYQSHPSIKAPLSN